MQQQLNKLIGKLRDKIGDPNTALMKVVKSWLFLSWVFFFVVLASLYIWYKPLDNKAEMVQQDLKVQKSKNHKGGGKKFKDKIKAQKKQSAKPGQGEVKPKKPAKPQVTDKPIVRQSSIALKLKQPKLFKPTIVMPRPQFDTKSVRKMAVIVTGLGLLAEQDKLILNKLPSKVAVAYNANSHRLMEQCRDCYNQKKREILLSLPLEPSQYPDVDPGKLTLLTGVPVEQNLLILKKLLHYNPFISGVIGDYGSTFLAVVADLAPVIEDLSRRELFFLDPQTCMQSQTMNICQQLKARCGRVDITFPTPALPEELDKLFDSAMELAQETGWALCVVPASKLVADKLPEWMRKMRKRKIALVTVKNLLEGLEQLKAEPIIEEQPKSRQTQTKPKGESI